MDAQQITVRRMEKPARRGTEEELEWFCKALGITEAPDTMAREILREILKKEGKGEGIRSITISRKMRVTRGGAIYHLNKLMQTGLIVRRGREYELRGDNLSETVDEIEGDMHRFFKNIRRIARDIDEEFGIEQEGE